MQLTQYEKSAIVGMWRMENPASVISAMLKIDEEQVIKTIDDYKFILEQKELKTSKL